jgi:hypothetical protein
LWALHWPGKIAFFVIAIIVLCLQQRVHPQDLVFAGADLLLAALFLTAFAKAHKKLQ